MLFLPKKQAPVPNRIFRSSELSVIDLKLSEIGLFLSTGKHGLSTLAPSFNRHFEGAYVRKISAFFVLLFCATAGASNAVLDYQGYLRTPVGTNSAGGKEIQINNPGSSGNEFRLGNETAYGEAYFTAHVLKPETKSDPFFNTNLTFAYNPPMNSQYGDTTSSTDNVQVIQAYVKGGNLDGLKMSFWAGKRFYRDVDVHMDDFFYFADMSGSGGGIEDIEMRNGTLSVAVLQYSNQYVVNTTNGLPSKQALDLRWRDLELSKKNKLFLWAAEGYTAPGSGTDTLNSNAQITYAAAHGTALGVRWRHDFTEKDFNDFAVIWGNSVMETFTLNADAYSPDGTDMGAKSRWRVVEHYSSELNDKWGLQGAAIYEGANNGDAGATHFHWYSLGVRPVYYITDHFHIVGQLGHSIIEDGSETTTTGGDAGERTLTRITIAPEAAIGKGLFARPVVRAYVTYSMWNEGNKDAGNKHSLVGNLNSQKITALNDKTSETQVGFEGEVWF